MYLQDTSHREAAQTVIFLKEDTVHKNELQLNLNITKNMVFFLINLQNVSFKETNIFMMQLMNEMYYQKTCKPHKETCLI